MTGASQDAGDDRRAGHTVLADIDTIESAANLATLYEHHKGEIVAVEDLFLKVMKACFVFGAGEISGDMVCRRFIHKNVKARFVFTEDLEDLHPYACRWSIKDGVSNFRIMRSREANQAHINVVRLFACVDLWKAAADSIGEMPEILWSIGDRADGPGLCFCDNQDTSVLIPDAYFLGLGGYADLKANYEVDFPLWESRSPQMLWRGSATGHLDADGRLPRKELCKLGYGRTDCDIGFNEHWGRSSDRYLRPTIHWTTFGDYRYHVDIDESSNSWPGLYFKLLCGGCVLKVASPLSHRQWYYDRLIPWVNFVPVCSDLSDLFEAFDLLRGDQDMARSIATAGRELALSMSLASEIAQAVEVIARYAAAKADRSTL